MHIYNDLLVHAFDTLDIDGQDTFSKVIKVSRSGSKLTAWSDFPDICTYLKRPKEHVKMFILFELGTDGHLDGAQSLLIRGRFTQRQVNSILQNYINVYVK